jgi:hypothetical protein
LAYQHEIPDSPALEGNMPAAGGTVSVDLIGTVFKVDQTVPTTKPVNIEYSDTIYNLSLIPCRGTVNEQADGKPSSDMSACVWAMKLVCS